ncbi:MAG: type II toxin-antitoxin system RelE/ParE family toxin [Desulfobulbaceae bacterium]|jgi:plasmid stabilization system protein ParE|nr:type II toxin-antitoxin system RelE/ParE family toxin [Desulfobulbaceae bacterium]
MKYQVVFAPEAREHLLALYGYLADAASPEAAKRYTDAVVTYCEGLSDFPHRGTKRNDIRSGLRVTNYKKRTVIAFFLEENVVSIIGIFYAGRDYERLLQAMSSLPQCGHNTLI